MVLHPPWLSDAHSLLFPPMPPTLCRFGWFCTNICC
eukprot:CCRYP_001219-RA/>CCRYP_001219-RA protein AED:0.28 eAED:1.00 QI:0/-1/0/1/-1/0/1/0/35